MGARIGTQCQRRRWHIGSTTADQGDNVTSDDDPASSPATRRAL